MPDTVNFRTTETPEKVPNSARIQELWTAVKAHVAVAVGNADYSTPDEVATAIATALADYATDAEVTSAITTALADYFTKAETQAEILKAVANVAGGGVTMTSVDTLPEKGTAKVIYLVPAANATDGNVKDEYIWLVTDEETNTGYYERIGSTAVDLTGFWGKDELEIMTSEEMGAILV